MRQTMENLTSTIFDQTIANLKAQLVENKVVRVMIPKCMSWLDAYDEPIGDMEDKVIFDEEKLESSWKFQEDDSWMTI
ncbi:hypothetical protein Tco_0383362 [Tanacetum coccineum]